jgi:hypothetical protein
VLIFNWLQKKECPRSLTEDSSATELVKLIILAFRSLAKNEDVEATLDILQNKT